MASANFRPASTYEISVSSWGLRYDLRIVGRKPRKSTIVINMTDHTGLLVKNHNANAKAAPNKLNLSEAVMSFSPFLIARPKIINETAAVTPVTYAPGPPLSESCPAKAMAVSDAHTSQVKACGFVFPAKMS
jgi:hypothetical protein